MTSKCIRFIWSLYRYLHYDRLPVKIEYIGLYISQLNRFWTFPKFLQRWLLQRWYYVKLTHIVAIQMHFTSWNQWQCLNMSKIFIYKWRYALFFFENTYLWKMIASFSPYCCHLGYYFSNNLTAQKVILKCHIWTILFCHFYKWKMVEYIASINEIYVFECFLHCCTYFSMK